MMGDTRSPFDGGTEPLSSSEFKQHIVSEYAAIADGVGIDASIGAAVDDIWPVVTDGDDAYPRSTVNEGVSQGSLSSSNAGPSNEAEIAPTVGSKNDYTYYPSYRENQRDAVVSVLHDLYVDDNSVVTLSAPTGAGKSLILHGVMSVLDNEFEKDAFFSTPLNALIDQVANDPFINNDVVTLKGKNNYTCVHRQDRGTPVDKAACQRVSDFDCEHKEQSHESGGCPYYSRKHTAQSHNEVVTNLSYLMANSMIPEEHGLSNRELVVVDECQSIEDFALNFVGVTVSDRSVPVVWDDITNPPRTENVEQLAEWLENEVLLHVRAKLETFEAKGELREEEVDQRDDLQEFSRKVDNFLQDVQNHHWTADHDYEENKVEFEPIFVGRFLDRFLWSQGHKVVLSSATIPKSGFLEEIGLEERSVGEVEVESTFPPERRGVYTDEVVGKMTWNERDQTIPKMARKIGELADYHSGKRGFVHCHSYKIAQRLYDALPADVRERTRLQDSDESGQSLEDWLNSSVSEKGFQDDRGGQVFLSVAMSEGISLDDDAARWQVIAKCAYPYLGAKRASYRVNELNDWNWYANKASIALQQAVGRGMRSKDDHCITYVLDSSAATLIERNEHLFESWFLEAVDIEPEGDRA